MVYHVLIIYRDWVIQLKIGLILGELIHHIDDALYIKKRYVLFESAHSSFKVVRFRFV